MNANQLWFVRHEGKVMGQFPVREIIFAISVGEFVLSSDEISPDQVNWLPLNRFPGLLPEQPIQKADKTLDEGEVQWREERAKAAERWETPVAPHDFRPPVHPLLKWLGALAALLAVSGLAAFVGWQWQMPEEQPKALTSPMPMPMLIPNCDAAPAPKVNWRGCDKSGTLLARSDLSSANLSNAKFNSTDLSASQFSSANLTQADFSYATLNQANLAHANLEVANLNFAELREADLSYANLRDANLAGAVLDGAKLDHATWTDGKVCAADSIGQCR